jgi:hypothetical protein
MSVESWSAQERAATGGRFAYAVEYQDVGTRSLPMAQIVLRSRARSARVFRAPASEGSVVLEVDSERGHGQIGRAHV